MKLSSKILLVWLSVMWTVFSTWIFAVTEFPLNFGFVGFQAVSGVVLIWTMIQYRNSFTTNIKVPSE